MKPPTLKLDDERLHPDTQDRATFQHHIARYEFALERIAPGERVLDAGCGAGYGTHLLSEKCAFALGIDYAPQALEFARGRYGGANVAFAAMNCHRLAVAEASVDCVIALEVFEHLENSEAFLAECSRVLRPGGRLILSTPNQVTHDLHMNSIGMKNEFHINLMSEKELHAALQKHFAEVEIYGQRRSGSRLYTALRALDVFNLRLRLLSSRRRERLQHAMGVPVGANAKPEAWIFSKSQLKQCNQFVAVCRKET
ncbi:MAG: class I SAM-dependent methyltransferase [Acidobacteria bacterium]|nr:class I SAM-dependent methyltransferase [Acidobacteriota bacterium]